jgi:hypothetical protein
VGAQFGSAVAVEVPDAGAQCRLKSALQLEGLPLQLAVAEPAPQRARDLFGPGRDERLLMHLE